MDKDKAVQGITVYAEFARHNATTQIIICGDGYNSAGTLVKGQIIRRTVSTGAPKAQWKFSRLSVELDESIEMTDEHKASNADMRLRYATSLFDQVLAGAWTMVKHPILVEVSRKDFDSIGEGKAPTKMLYRIAQSRTALDFPADLVNDMTVAV